MYVNGGYKITYPASFNVSANTITAACWRSASRDACLTLSGRQRHSEEGKGGESRDKELHDRRLELLDIFSGDWGIRVGDGWCCIL
jgi:hypothetical protein